MIDQGELRHLRLPRMHGSAMRTRFDYIAVVVAA